jgi:hypothetical protein
MKTLSKSKKPRKVSYNKKLKLWQLHDTNTKIYPEDGSNGQFVKTKSQALKWLKGELGNGNCYETSAKFVLDSKENKSLLDLKLCHGQVHGQGPLEGAIFGHSWVEYNQIMPSPIENLTNHNLPLITMVLDKSNGKSLEIPAPIYYLMGNIQNENVVKYNKKEVLKKIIETEHWGPWD